MTRRHFLEPSNAELHLRAVLARLADAHDRALKQLKDAAEHVLDSLLQASRGVAEVVNAFLPF